MPWTPKQVAKLLGPDSPLTPAQREQMKAELKADPTLGHAVKGSRALKKSASATRRPSQGRAK